MKPNYSDMATKELRAKVLADPNDQDAFYMWKYISLGLGCFGLNLLSPLQN